MKIWTKQTPSDVCVVQQVINSEPSYTVANFWPMAALLRIVELLSGDVASIDFDDAPVSYEFAWDLEAAGILERYEDEVYWRGPNFDVFKMWLMNQHEAEPVEVEL